MIVTLQTQRVRTSRRRTPEGLLIATATLTQAGTVEYDPQELGVPGTTPIKLERTLDTMRHSDTLSSAASAPVTLLHPERREVTPDNYRSEVIGHIFGTPTVSPSGALEAEILIGDADASGPRALHASRPLSPR